ncbi:D-alanyl-D-alanine carboxypeptidase family protein [Gehongia tenuis]|uniref:serine-type D-Ala-D-Ala carboxypeptidase n=1 Tax=Gehongia tenuis TaxID=2763655 RepID=A0A926HP11_9FIRM|nr:D-alanyl-D-alanine carboxypeptidase family protein [Gehongia tenuis]MBC8531184.1 D-alanyl-D-alanine carboxypeptidase [Gehongia tenuis]
MKRMGKHCLLFLLMLCILMYPLSAVQAEALEEMPFDVSAKSALLMDADSGTIIFEKAADEKLPIASVTKIMTLTLCFEALESGAVTLDQEVNVSQNAASMGGSQVFLDAGQPYKVENLLESIIVASANDASVAMAETIAGSEEVFVERMNTKAAELGMTGTHFANCTGLPQEDHYSTARDVAAMSQELIQHPDYFKWSTIWMDELSHAKDGRVTELTNTNRMVRFYDGADGIKTGSTDEAKYCLSVSAKRGEFRLIGVLLGSESSAKRFDEATKMLDYGFANYETVSLGQSGEIKNQSVAVKGGRDAQVPVALEGGETALLRKGTADQVEKSVNLPEVVEAPVVKGAKLGEMIITHDGETLANLPIVAAADVPKAGYGDILKKILSRW